MYSKVSGEPSIDSPTIDVTSKEFYGEGYDDSDKRIPDMTIINKQLGIVFFLFIIYDVSELLRTSFTNVFVILDFTRLEP